MTSRLRVRRSLPTAGQLRDVLPRRTGDRLTRATSIEDLRALARRRVPRAVFDYVDGGAERETSMARSRDAFSRVEFRPSALSGVADVDLRTEVLGTSSAMPLVLAPTGFTRLMHHHGEVGVAMAGAKEGVPYTLSTMGTTSIEEVTLRVPNARRWFQLYLWRDRAASADFVARAVENGYEALVLTVDTPVGGRRLRDVRNGMTIPPSLTPRTLLDAARKPRWWVNMLSTGPLEFASLTSFRGQVADLATQVFDPTVTWEDLVWLRKTWTGKLIVKGVQTVEDSARAVECGADAVVVSNHGGRQLDRSPVPLEVLPAVVELIGDAAEVHVDGGILSGGDVAAAIGLGARAAWIGRAYLYGLMAGGSAGVNRALTLIAQELRTTMQLLGVSTPAELAGRVRLRS